MRLLPDREAVLDDLGCHEDQQFIFIVVSQILSEKEPKNGNVSQQRNLGYCAGLILGINATKADSTAIFDQHFCRYLLGVYRRTSARSRTHTVLVDVQFHYDVVVGRNLWLDLQAKRGLAKGDAGGPTAGRLLVWNFGTLFDGGFGVVCRNHART